MFLELSFDSEAGSKIATSSKAARSWRYDRDDKQELSLDELISDFRASASSLKQQSGRGTNATVSPLRTVSPPKHSKAKESNKKSWGFQSDRSEKNKNNRSVKTAPKDESGESEGEGVMPTPRLDRVLKQRSSLASKRRVPATHSTVKAPQRRKPAVRSPVLSSPSLTPPSLSPLTSVATSPSEGIYTPVSPEEDSIDALVGKDIRELNKLILTGSRSSERSGAKKVRATRSPTTEESSDVLRQSTRFRKEASNRSSQQDGRFKDDHLCSSRSSYFRLKVPEKKTESTMQRSPPPPPPDEDDDDEEDSFAEELRKLRESRRFALISSKAAEKSSPKEEATAEISGIRATAALRVRNASNAINDLLLEALKPFEDRQREQEQEQEAKLDEPDEVRGDAAIRNAATAELQSATQTIVSQLDLTFADMVERRKADLKADTDADAAAKEAEKKEKEAADEKKAAEEKESKEREMEILRLIPMHGKLLTCSSDIKNVLEQLECTDISAPVRPIENSIAMEAEIESLRSQMQRRIQEIEARMVAPSSTELSSRGNEVSWRTVDWVRDNFELNDQSPPSGGKTQRQECDYTADKKDMSPVVEGEFGEILQRQVMENLDLTILKLKHVLAIDTKEAAEAQEKRRQENAALERQKERERLESERKQHDLADAESAKRRVMGLTSVDEVEGWADEERRFQTEINHDQVLECVMATLDNRMNLGQIEDLPICSEGVLSGRDEALQHFDRLKNLMTANLPTEETAKEGLLEHGDWGRSGARIYHNSSSSCRRKPPSKIRQQRKEQWLEPLSCSDSDGEVDSTSSAESDESLPSVPIRQRPTRSSRRDMYQMDRSPVPSPRLQSQQQQQFIIDARQGRKLNIKRDGYSDGGMQYENVYRSSRPKQKTNKGKMNRLQEEIGRTIQALQLERRQKASWVKNHLHHSHDLPVSPTFYR